MNRPDLLARHLDAVTIARRRERVLWCCTFAAAAFGWGVILTIGFIVAVVF